MKPIVSLGFMTRGQMKGSVEDGGLTACAKNRKESLTACGPFAIAFTYHAALGDDLQTITFNQDNKLRTHLVTCFEKRSSAGFPHIIQGEKGISGVY